MTQELAKCDELDRLSAISSHLYSEYQRLSDDVKMTSNKANDYRKKIQELKRLRGQLREAHQNLQNHIRDHGCR